jgi:hypothetical protein
VSKRKALESRLKALPKLNQLVINKKEENTEEPGDELIAFDEHNRDILKQIEQELKLDRRQNMIIYEINADVRDTTEVVNGSNLIIPRQVRYFAPFETRTYIIIKSRNSNNPDAEVDWSSPGKLRIQSIYKH